MSIRDVEMEIDGKPVILLDTPGFDDTYRSDADVLKEIAAWLATAYSDGHKLSGIIYMHPITEEKMQGSMVRYLMMFQNLVGDTALSNVTLVTNRWSFIDQDVGETREQKLKGLSYWGPMIELGSEVKRFDGTANDARKIVASLLKTDQKALKIQNELVDDHLKLSQTQAGIFVQQTFEKSHKLQEKKMAELLSKVESAETAGKEDRVAARRELERVQAENADLKTQISRLQESHESRIDHLEAQLLNAPPPYAAEVEQTANIATYAAAEEQAATIAEKPPNNDPNSPVSDSNPPIPPISKLSESALQSVDMPATFFESFRPLWRPRIPAGHRRLEWRCVSSRNQSVCIAN